MSQYPGEPVFGEESQVMNKKKRSMSDKAVKLGYGCLVEVDLGSERRVERLVRG